MYVYIIKQWWICVIMFKNKKNHKSSPANTLNRSLNFLSNADSKFGHRVLCQLPQSVNWLKAGLSTLHNTKKKMIENLKSMIYCVWILVYINLFNQKTRYKGKNKLLLFIINFIHREKSRSAEVSKTLHSI